MVFDAAATKMGPDGTLYIRFLKEDGGWHRTSIAPGMDPDMMLDAVHKHVTERLGDVAGVRSVDRIFIKMEKELSDEQARILQQSSQEAEPNPAERVRDGEGP